MFASFSVLTSWRLAKGIPLISVAETCVLGGGSNILAPKRHFYPRANLIVLLLAVCVAAGEGYSLGQSGVPNYTYLKEGNIQFRVDSHRGRTDRLSVDGWMPVSFDRPAEAIPPDMIPRLVLTDGIGMQPRPPPAKYALTYKTKLPITF